MKRYCLNPHIIISEVAGEMVAVPLVESVAQMDKVFTLNKTAAFIVQYTRQPKTLAEITFAMTEEYDIEPKQAELDILEILEQGIALNLFSTDENK